MNPTRTQVAEAASLVAPPGTGQGGHVTEIVGTSDDSVDAAIDEGVARAVGPSDRLEWLEITGVRSNVLGGMQRYRVGLRLGLRSAA